MKIGIVTIYDNTNIGNRLQNYALQTILLKFADSVITIKNKPFSSLLIQRIKIKMNIGDSILINRLMKHDRKVSFLEFNKRHIKTSNKCYYYNREYHRKIENCDFYCTGSDQVWNPALNITGRLHFLDFSPKNCNFSYAASLGVDEIAEEYANEVEKGLSNIKYISVREESGKDIIKKLTGRTDAETLIDPTLYLTSEEWEKISVKPKVECPHQYVVLYFLGGMGEARRKEILRVALERGLEVVDLLEKNSLYYSLGPGEFLYLIKNASLVCTDSFHASVFSFIFEIPLSVFPREGKQSNMGGRLTNLTEKFGLQDCMIRNDKISEKVWKVDYTYGKRVLQGEKRKVDIYLKSVFHMQGNNTVGFRKNS